MDLYLPLKQEYFDQIQLGVKDEEYRLVTPYWIKRLQGRVYDRVLLTAGYPKKTDRKRRIVIRWKGIKRKVINHPHFGSEPVEVFAIDVSGDRL